MQITTLGPLAVDGRLIRGERLITLVRTLIGARGRAVSTTSLVEAIWYGEPPADSAGAIQALVSRVRRLGLPVVAVSGGYRVPVEDLSVDAVDVRALVERARAALRSGDPATARRLGDEARGRFPEVPELEDPETARLLADAAALRAEAALAGAGPYDEADLRRLTAHAPPHEPSAALLVRTLAAQGRDAEALDVVERLREELADRYGTDPSPVVAEAHLALLRGELRTRRPEATKARRATTNLPVAWRRPATALVGRDDDLAAVTAALGEAPVVTVVATGGAGKTRLAVEVARRATAAGQAVHVVELAGVRSPVEVGPTVLAAIGGAIGEGLRDTARDLDGLVVLDNCEHLLAAAADAVADLLAVAAPDLSVLATSRAPLSLPGEIVYRLRALPDADALGLLEARVRAGGGPSIGDPDRALDLCHRLDNLPLALELAAARLRHMPIEDVLTGLTDRFALLDDALRGLPERHASLWAMVDWSRELLIAEDRELLQRLAVIPAPFTTETAVAVAPGAGDVRRGLATLVEQSLLTLDEGDDGRPRYRMLETVREYGEVRLDAAGDRASAMGGLVEWARAVAVALLPEFSGPGQIVAFSRCAADVDNLVAALRWAHDRDDEPAAVDLAATLFHLWTVRSGHLEVVAWARRLTRVDDPIARRRSALLHGRATGRPLPNAERLAWMFVLLGINGLIGDSHRVFALTVRAWRTLLAERGDEVSPRAAALAAVMPVIGSSDQETGLAAANDMIANADVYVQSMGYLLRAALQENRGLPDLAALDGEEAYRRFEAAGNQWGMGVTAQGLGEWYTNRGRPGADEWLRRGERHLQLIGATEDVGAVRVLLDVQAALSGDEEAAERLRVAAGSGELKEIDTAQANLGLAVVEWHQGRLDAALTHAEIAIDTADRMVGAPAQIRATYRAGAAVLYLRRAAIQASAADVTAAVTRLREAAPHALSSLDIPVLGSWALAGAALAAYQGDKALARELWAAGLSAGANMVYLFQPGQDERLAEALDGWSTPERPVADATDRIRKLMEEVLRPSSGTPGAPAA